MSKMMKDTTQLAWKKKRKRKRRKIRRASKGDRRSNRDRGKRLKQVGITVESRRPGGS